MKFEITEEDQELLARIKAKKGDKEEEFEELEEYIF